MWSSRQVGTALLAACLVVYLSVILAVHAEHHHHTSAVTIRPYVVGELDASRGASVLITVSPPPSPVVVSASAPGVSPLPPVFAMDLSLIPEIITAARGLFPEDEIPVLIRVARCESH